jgi:hypothetical protein
LYLQQRYTFLFNYASTFSCKKGNAQRFVDLPDGQLIASADDPAEVTRLPRGQFIPPRVTWQLSRNRLGDIADLSDGIYPCWSK